MLSDRKRRCWTVVNPAATDGAAYLVGRMLYLLIAGNVVVAVLQTVDALESRYGLVFEAIAIGSVLTFAIVYALRVWAAPAGDTAAGPIASRLDYVTRPDALIDLLVIGPFVLGVALSAPVLELVRLLWIVRFLGLPRLTQARRRLNRVIRREWADLSVAVTASGSVALLAATPVSRRTPCPASGVLVDSRRALVECRHAHHRRLR